MTVPVGLSCPSLPKDIRDEAQRKTKLEGKTALEVTGSLILQRQRTRAALKRAIKAHDSCRKS